MRGEEDPQLARGEARVGLARRVLLLTRSPRLVLVSGRECFFQTSEGFLGFQGPAEGDILLEETCDGYHDTAVFIDEFPVEVSESKEDLNVMLG